MSSEMTGGTAYRVKRTYPFSNNKSKPLDLYVYVVLGGHSASTDDEGNTTYYKSLQLGMYLYMPTGYYISNWTDTYGSYVGDTNEVTTTDLSSYVDTNGHVNGGKPIWLISDRTMTVKINPNSSTTVSIPWKWGVYSTWGGYTNPSGTLSYVIPSQNLDIDKCGKPALSGDALTIVNNVFTFKGSVGTNGDNTLNKATGINVYINYSGAEPTKELFDYKLSLDGSSETFVSKSFTLDMITEDVFKSMLANGKTSIPISYRCATRSSVSDNYDSDLTDNVTIQYFMKTYCKDVYFNLQLPDKIYNTDKLEVSWTISENGLNNNFSKYLLRLKNVDTNTELRTINIYNIETTTYTINDMFTDGKLPEVNYELSIKSVGDNISKSSYSSNITFKVEATPYGSFIWNGKKLNVTSGTMDTYNNMYFDIGSGNICELSWENPQVEAGFENQLIGYELKLSNETEPRKIGLVNNYYIKSFGKDTNNEKILKEPCEITFTLTPISKFTTEDKNESITCTINCVPSSGIYVKDNNIWKRSVGLEKVDNTWIPMEDCYYYDKTNSKWVKSDVSYEILYDSNGEKITDSSDNDIYTY